MGWGMKVAVKQPCALLGLWEKDFFKKKLLKFSSRGKAPFLCKEERRVLGDD